MSRKVECVRFILGAAIVAICCGVFFTDVRPAACAGEPLTVVKAVRDFYFKQAKDFTLDFKVDSKLKDIAFAGKFMLHAPLNFAIEAKSTALEVKIVFKNGDGFIYLPTANIMTNLDAVTRAKTRGIKIPSTPAQLDEQLDKLPAEFELEVSEEGDNIAVSGKSKKARGSFKAVVDKATYEIRSITTFNKSGAQELVIELINFKHEAVNEKLFEKPQGAIETNLPIPVF
ncbi:MAG: hypothetical protein A2008_08850 [Candidatus Wallbacteria bacterium GWC2_49_35]|uniref:Outer-membrane lipoprotein carrier protein n=1 Tax=Candidatus Wallbacteria bacterium GWC2_49_35 TaxID=1817813 RepID=A0A1F7WLN6_9BACT|nr:MAG: hypothetical protein A2008_08850 [Candidatus Wallbacteria bacterium GWC2_49_35]HBC75597.1 hypothetical protein [Candidatus Wallbacteria bacterium]